MAGLRISEAARRAGLSMSAMRFYEGAGVLSPPARSPNGYRRYEDSDVARLRFLARARELGLGLDEVRDLLAVWDGGRCGTTQERLGELVSARLAAIDAHICEFELLRADLERARLALLAPTAAGPCGPDCACMTATETHEPGPTELSTEPAAATAIVCSLDAGQLPDRMRAWNDVLSRAESRAATTSGVQLVLPAEPALTARVAELAALEQQCCSFFEFTLTLRTPGQLLLEVSAPPEARSLVDALLEMPAQPA